MVVQATRFLILLLSLFCLSFLLQIVSLSSSRAGDTLDRGVISPNLAVARLFSSLRGKEIASVSRIFMQGDEVVLEGLEGVRYKGYGKIVDYFSDWMDEEDIDLGVRVSDVSVRHQIAEVEGVAEGEVLSLYSGLARGLRVNFYSRFIRCEQDSRWCINILVLEKVEGDD